MPEFTMIIGPLADPRAHGGDLTDAFDLEQLIAVAAPPPARIQADHQPRQHVGQPGAASGEAARVEGPA